LFGVLELLREVERLIDEDLGLDEASLVLPQGNGVGQHVELEQRVGDFGQLAEHLAQAPVGSDQIARGAQGVGFDGPGFEFELERQHLAQAARQLAGRRDRQLGEARGLPRVGTQGILGGGDQPGDQKRIAEAPRVPAQERQTLGVARHG
jgi:hypothetical protein